MIELMKYGCIFCDVVILEGLGMMSGIVLCSKRQMNCMEWIYKVLF